MRRIMKGGKEEDKYKSNGNTAAGAKRGRRTGVTIGV